MKEIYPNQKPALGLLLAAWMVHLYTASGAIIGLFTLYYIAQQEYIVSLWLMYVAILIDATDGALARRVKIKQVIPKIDGALMDNIIDYLNYVIVPCFFLMMHPTMLPQGWEWPIVGLIVGSSVYQFTQIDAKTPDHFFKGFPSYWNIIVLYLFIFTTQTATNAAILISLAVLVFVPIKYIYPSRLDYLTDSNALRYAMQFSSVLYFLSIIGLLLTYPEPATWAVVYSFAYIIFYLGFSLFRTYVPLLKQKLKA